jgi:two-component system NtrC family sensor kinase
MPDMDGAGLWRAVTAAHPRLARAMLFVTGDTLSPDAHSFLKSTRCDSLDKPFSRADLLAKVAALLA